MLCPQLASAKYIDTWIKFFIHSFIHSFIQENLDWKTRLSGKNICPEYQVIRYTRNFDKRHVKCNPEIPVCNIRVWVCLWVISQVGISWLMLPSCRLYSEGHFMTFTFGIPHHNNRYWSLVRTWEDTEIGNLNTCSLGHICQLGLYTEEPLLRHFHLSMVDAKWLEDC